MNDTNSNLLETSLLNLTEAIQKNSSSASQLYRNLPEFTGRLGEKAPSFLSKFDKLTTGYTDGQKCLAFKVALIKDADVWLRTYHASDIVEEKWQDLRTSFKKRFYSPDEANPKKRLMTMRYQLGGEQSLVSFMDNYYDIYKKVYPSHQPSEDPSLIDTVYSNLPAEIKIQLNYLGKNSNVKEWEQFREIVSTYELEIVGNIPPEPKVNKSALVDLLREMKNELRDEIKGSKKEVTEETEKIAIAYHHPRSTGIKNYQNGHDNNQGRPNFDNQHRSNTPAIRGRTQKYFANKPRFSPYNNNYRRNFNTYNGRNNRPYQSRESLDQKDNPPTQSDRPASTEHSGQPQVSQYRTLYEQEHGTVGSPCKFCGGSHFNRHCPFNPDNLNRKGCPK